MFLSITFCLLDHMQVACCRSFYREMLKNTTSKTISRENHKGALEPLLYLPWLEGEAVIYDVNIDMLYQQDIILEVESLDQSTALFVTLILFPLHICMFSPAPALSVDSLVLSLWATLTVFRWRLLEELLVLSLPVLLQYR